VRVVDLSAIRWHPVSWLLLLTVALMVPVPSVAAARPAHLLGVHSILPHGAPKADEPEPARPGLWIAGQLGGTQGPVLHGITGNALLALFLSLLALPTVGRAGLSVALPPGTLRWAPLAPPPRLIS
jgi:hypothetical protein